jgi:hypothetical protein
MRRRRPGGDRYWGESGTQAVAHCRVPDATFFNPATGLVHVAIGEPGLVETIDPRTGARTKTMTAAGAHTTAFVAPDILYVFSPAHRGALVLRDAQPDSTSADLPSARAAARSV